MACGRLLFLRINIMPRLRALISSADRKAGDEFDATDEEAHFLCAPDLPGGQRAEYVDRAMRPVTLPGTAPRFEDAPEKHRYLRRDLRAQN
jgi:hypothetical protein